MDLRSSEDAPDRPGGPGIYIYCDVASVQRIEIDLSTHSAKTLTWEELQSHRRKNPS